MEKLKMEMATKEELQALVQEQGHTLTTEEITQLSGENKVFS